MHMLAIVISYNSASWSRLRPISWRNYFCTAVFFLWSWQSLRVVEIFLALYANPNFTTVFTSARHWPLSRAIWNQSKHNTLFKNLVRDYPPIYNQSPNLRGFLTTIFKCSSSLLWCNLSCSSHSSLFGFYANIIRRVHITKSVAM
jgi:hypothetical protein